MQISKKAQYAIRAVLRIAKYNQNKPIQISEISKKEKIPIKFLEQILLSLKKNNLLKSRRGANGGYLIAKPCNEITIGLILKIIDGPFDPVGINSGNNFDYGLEKYFRDMIDVVDDYLDKFTIQDVIEIEENHGLIAFEI